MDCYIKVSRTDRCVACHKDFHGEERGAPVRIEDESGFSISLMCPSCMQKVTEYREHKKSKLGV